MADETEPVKMEANGVEGGETPGSTTPSQLSTPKGPMVMTRLVLGKKRKVKKIPEELPFEMLRQMVVAALPELQDTEWHGEYDDGCWIENADDWSIAVELFKEEAEKSGQKFFLMNIVSDKSTNHSAPGQPLPPGTEIPTQPTGTQAPNSGAKRKAGTLPPPLTDEDHSRMDKEIEQTSKKQKTLQKNNAANFSSQWQGGPPKNPFGGQQGGGGRQGGSSWQTGHSAGRGGNMGGGPSGGWQSGPQVPGYGQQSQGYGQPSPGYGGGWQGQPNQMAGGRGGWQQRGGGQQTNRNQRKQDHNQKMEMMKMKVLDIMRRKGAPMNSLWLRKELPDTFGEPKPKIKTVDWMMHSLMEKGQINRQEGKNGKWEWFLIC
eukprot:877898_1